MTKRMKAEGLPQHLRKWGLKVEESPGWKTNGRPYDFTPRAIICHHTASNSRGGNFASYGIVRSGRTGLPGPLCQFLLGRDGTVRIISSGYANHAGYGGPLAGIPANQGNTYSIGIEAENNGVGEDWGPEQLKAYARLCAALMVWIGISDVSKVIGHKEWAPRRKIDPAGINMNEFRKSVKAALAAGPRPVSISVSSVQPGKSSTEVLKLKKKLKAKGYRGFLMNNTFGPGTKRAYAKWQKRIGLKGKDADGRPGSYSLGRLGFVVKK